VFQVDKLRKWKQDHVEQMASDLEDDATCGSDMNRRLSDLRKEVASFIIYTGCLPAISAAAAFFLSPTEPRSPVVTVHCVHIKARNSFEVAALLLRLQPTLFVTRL